MPVEEYYWLCLPASPIRPLVQTVRVVQSCPRGCWLPLVLPSVPEPSSVPAPMPGGSHSAAPPPPPSSTAPPSASQAGCPTDSKLCLLPLTSNGRQEKNGQSGLVSLGTFLLLKLKLDFLKSIILCSSIFPIIISC